MKTYYSKHLCISMLMFFCCGNHFAQIKKDTLKTLISFDNLSQNNILLTTDNPTAIYTVKNIATVQAGYQITQGEYVSYNEPKTISSLNFLAKGYTKPKNISFYGSIAYLNSREKQLKWNNTSFISTNNPFVFADSIASNFDNEIFILQGKMASKFKNSNIKWGIDVNYKVGNKVDQIDPRPTIKSQRIAVKPGIFYEQEKWSFGLNFYYEEFNEEISVTSVDYNTNYYFFKFLGFGVFFKDSGDSYSRNYTGNNYGASFQTHYIKNKDVQSIFEIQYINKYERAEEGNLKTRFLGGDYKSSIISFYNKWILHSSDVSRYIMLRAKLERVKGIWFDQRQELADDRSLFWKVYNKSIRNKTSFLDAEVAYTFLKNNFSIKASTIFNAQKLNIYPSNYYKNIYNLTPNVTYKNLWLHNNNQMHITANFGYRFSVKKDISVDNIELLNLITLPEYYYQASDVLSLHTEFKIGFSNWFSTNLLPYVSFKTGFMFAKEDDFYNQPIRYNTAIRLGVVF